MIYLQLLLSFLEIGAFSFGGGYAALPLIQEQVVSVHTWLSVQEFTDLVTISQMTPGPIAINAATFVGIKVGGVFGAICATIGCVLPACIIVSILAFIYIKYQNVSFMQGILDSLRPAVVAMIATAGLLILISTFWGEGESISLDQMKIGMVVLFVIAMILLRKTKLNPILIMLICGGINLAAGILIPLFQ